MKVADKNTFRNINNTEKNAIYNSLSKLSSKIITIISNLESEFFISFNSLSLEKRFPSIYLVPNSLIKIYNKIELQIYINSAGIYFGFIKRNQFLLSCEGAELLHKLNCFTGRQQIYLNNEGEKSILYGNKVLKNMIALVNHNLKKNDFVLIFNQKKELIALAKSQVDYNEIKMSNNNKQIAINLVDKGYYLRIKQ